MITIDFIDVNAPSAEKPNHRTEPVLYPERHGMIDRLYTWALHQQNDLLQAAHRARLGGRTLQLADRRPEERQRRRAVGPDGRIRVPTDVQDEPGKRCETLNLPSWTSSRSRGMTWKGRRARRRVAAAKKNPAEAGFSARGADQSRRRRRTKPSPARPIPSSARVAGSGASPPPPSPGLYSV